MNKVCFTCLSTCSAGERRSRREREGKGGRGSGGREVVKNEDRGVRRERGVREKIRKGEE